MRLVFLGSFACASLLRFLGFLIQLLPVKACVLVDFLESLGPQNQVVLETAAFFFAGGVLLLFLFNHLLYGLQLLLGEHPS